MASSSPCTTAATITAGTDVPPAMSPARPSSRSAISGVAAGRPHADSGTVPAAARRCSLASTWRGARSHVSASGPSPPPTRSAPCTTGSVTVPARTSSSSYAAPSSAADARAPRSTDSALTGPLVRRSARWPSSRSMASRAAAAASATSGRSRSGARGSAIPEVTALTVRDRPECTARAPPEGIAGHTTESAKALSRPTPATARAAATRRPRRHPTPPDATFGPGRCHPTPSTPPDAAFGAGRCRPTPPTPRDALDTPSARADAARSRRCP